MEIRGILKRILTGNVSAREARQKLTGNTYDLTLLSLLEYGAYVGISNKIAQGGYESLTDRELYLCILLCYKADPDSNHRFLIEDQELTDLNTAQAENLHHKIQIANNIIYKK